MSFASVEVPAGDLMFKRIYDPKNVSREALINSSKTNPVYTMIDFPAKSGGFRTLTSNIENIVNESLSTADPFDMNPNVISSLRGAAFNLVELTYTASVEAFFSGVDVSFLNFFTMALLGNTSATLFDIMGIKTSNFDQTAIIRTRFQTWLSLGTIEESRLVVNNCAFLDGGGLTLLNSPDLRIIELLIFNFSDKSSIFITYDGCDDLSGKINGLTATTFPNESVLNIRPSIGENSRLFIEGSSFTDNEITPFLGDVFWKGVQGDITVIADASITITSITSVTDSSGTARFNFTGPTLYNFQKVTIISFVTNTAYNVTGIITDTDGTTYFEISSVLFGTDEATGTFTSDSITLTSTGHGRTNGESLSVKESINHNVGSYVYNSLTNTFQVNKAFTSTELAIWDTSSLDQKDPRVISGPGNIGIPVSRSIGSFISQGNDVETIISDIGEGESGYVDLDLGLFTGSITAYADNGIGGTTVSSAAHGQPNERLLEIKGSTSYNGQREIFNVTTNTYDIDVAFVADDGVGTWRSGAFSGVDIERWQVVDFEKGILRYIGLEEFDGNYTATISAKAVGGAAKRYKFILLKSTDNGVTYTNGFALPVEISATVTTAPFQKDIVAETNNLFKLGVANFDNTANIIIDTIAVSVK